MPEYPKDQQDQIRDLQKAVAELQAIVSRRGKLNVVQGGTLDVLEADGDPVARIGEIGGVTAIRLYYPSGQLAFYSGQVVGGVATYLYRDDGTTAFSVYGAPGQPQFAAIHDRSGNQVVTDDTTSGLGIAVPYIPFGPFSSASVPADVTSSGTFTTLQSSVGYKMNPRVTMQILGRASDGSTAGELRVIDEGGNQIGSTITVAAGAFQYYTVSATALLGAFKASKVLSIQGRVTSGPGTIGVRGIYAIGIQS